MNSPTAPTPASTIRADPPPWSDERGPIPTFPPRALDEQGRLVPISAEERRARNDAVRRVLRLLSSRPAPAAAFTLDELMLGLNAARPEGHEVFGGPVGPCPGSS